MAERRKLAAILAADVNGMVERNAGLPPDRRIDFRVGVHLGDVIEESDDDLMGDGVNMLHDWRGSQSRCNLPLRGRLSASEVAARSRR
jgi:hypothetical protein